MRDEDDPITIEKRAAQAIFARDEQRIANAAFADARRRALAGFAARTAGPGSPSPGPPSSSGIIDLDNPAIIDLDSQSESNPEHSVNIIHPELNSNGIPENNENSNEIAQDDAKLERLMNGKSDRWLKSVADILKILRNKCKDETFTDVERAIRDELNVNCVLADEDDDAYMDDVIGAAVEQVKMWVAMDSGSVDNVVHPDDLPADVRIIPNAAGTKHFKGANDSHIERFGTIETVLQQDGMAPIRSDWVGADVTRALHSVSKVCGKPAAPKQDVLFNAEKCYVVPPGVVAKIMETIKAVAEYDRLGGLYVAEMTVSSFTRQGPKA